MASKRSLQSVSCLCGTEVQVDPMNRDRRVTCGGCGNTFDFAVTMDQSNRNSRVSLILPRGIFKPEGESLALSPRHAEPTAEFEPLPETEPEPAPPPPPPPRTVPGVPRKGPKTIQILMGHCECGTVFPLEDNGELTSVQSCPACKRAYHVVFKLESGTHQKTAIIVPAKPLLHRRMVTTPPKPPKGATKVIKTVAPPPKAKTQESSTTDFFGGGKKGRTRVTKVPRQTTVPPKARGPVEIPVGAQAAPCACGETFIIRRKDVNQVLTCASCGAKARATESRDPQTLAPTIRMRPV